MGGNAWMCIAGLGGLLIVIKLILIRYFSVKGIVILTFFNSLRNANKYKIENADKKSIREYYSINNIVNVIFYTICVIMLLAYLLIRCM